jgi:MFS family permease
MTQSDSTAEISLWRHPAFVRYLYVRVAASVALQIHVVAVGWQMYAMTGSPFRLGLIGLVQFIPAICLFPFTGHVADRFDRRWVTFIAEIVEAVAAAVLAVASFTGHLTPDLLLAMAFVIGTGRAFEQPSVQTVLPNVVPAKVLPNAVAAATSGSQTAVVAGPALGGILVALSPTLVFSVCALIWFTAGLAMITVAMERTASARMPLDLKTLFSGVTFILRRKVVLGAIVFDLLAVLLGSVLALLPVFAHDIYVAGPLGFGILRAAPAVGAIATALVLAHWPVSHRVGRVMFVTITIFGIATICVALAPNFVFAIGAMAVIGASDTVSVVIRQTMVQLRTPDEMRGRVYAVNSMAVITSNQLGDFRAGAAASLFGTIPAVLIGGFSILAVVLVSRRIFSELYDADRYDIMKS